MFPLVRIFRLQYRIERDVMQLRITIDFGICETKVSTRSYVTPCQYRGIASVSKALFLAA